MTILGARRSGIDSRGRLPFGVASRSDSDSRLATGWERSYGQSAPSDVCYWNSVPLILLILLVTVTTLRLPWIAVAQGLTGALIGTVKDAQGGVLPGAVVRVSSPALIGGPATLTTNEKGQLRFPALPPGSYVLDIELQGFATYHEEDIRIGAGATIERTAVLKLAGVAESVVVEGAGSRIEARDPGFGTRFGPEDLKAIPTRRVEHVRLHQGRARDLAHLARQAAPTTTVSAFGSGTNENQFLIDGTNFTCPCNGVARAEPGIDFIQEVQVQSVGASAEFGNMQGAVINVVTRQGSDRFLYDASYYGQTAGLTSQPVRLPYPGSGQPTERVRARQVPRLHDEPRRSCRSRSAVVLRGIPVPARLRQSAGHRSGISRGPTSRTRSSRSSPGDWLRAGSWFRAFTTSSGSTPNSPTFAKPFEATLRLHASVPAMTFGHLTHTLSANTVWDVRVGRFVYSREDDPSTGNLTTPSRFDRVTGVSSGAPQTFGGLTLIRTTAKATLNHYRPGLLGADHQWKIGGQVEQGEHHGPSVIPTGVRFVDDERTAVSGHLERSLHCRRSVHHGRRVRERRASRSGIG